MDLTPKINIVSQHPEITDQEFQRKKLKKACQDFEALFLKQMLETMRKAGFSDGKETSPMALQSNNPLQGMFDWHMAQNMSSSSPLGIADQLIQAYDIRNSSNANGSNSELNQRQNPGKGYLVKLIREVSKRHDIDPLLVSTIIKHESDGNRWAVSSKGAKGLMQVMDQTGEELSLRNPFNSNENIQAGVKYLKQMLVKYDNDVSLALAAYNAGPSAVDKYNGIPPYKETQEYVKNILADYHELSENKSDLQTELGADDE